jgi:hypothetical protein
MYFIQNCFICRPSDFTVSEGAGIEPMTVATSALAIRRATSHPLIVKVNPVGSVVVAAGFHCIYLHTVCV